MLTWILVFNPVLGNLARYFTLLVCSEGRPPNLFYRLDAKYLARFIVNFLKTICSQRYVWRLREDQILMFHNLVKGFHVKKTKVELCYADWIHQRIE